MEYVNIRDSEVKKLYWLLMKIHFFVDKVKERWRVEGEKYVTSREKEMEKTIRTSPSTQSSRRTKRAQGRIREKAGLKWRRI